MLIDIHWSGVREPYAVVPMGERGRGEQAARGELHAVGVSGLVAQGLGLGAGAHGVRGPYALVGSVLEHERGRDGRSDRAEEPHDGD